MSDLSSAALRRRTGWGVWLLALAAFLALIDAIFNYVWTGNGIHGTEGALLVVVSSALILIAALLFAFQLLGRRWLRVLFDVLLLLGMLGTATAAYFLEAWILLGLMVIAFIGWLGHLWPGQARQRLTTRAAS